MPIYSIQAPNGKTYQIEGPAGASQDQVIAEVLRQNPDAGQAAQQEVGMLGRGMRGLESLLSSQRTAIESAGDGTDAALRGLERGEAIQKKYPGMDDWEAVSKMYKEKGLPSAIGEYIGRVPGALAEQAPQIAESAATARLGAAAAGAPGAAVGAFAPSFTQQYGSFLERQADEQRKAGQPVDVNRFTAAAAAVPAAMIDTLATYIPMGKGIVKSVLGKEVSELLFKGATKEAELLAAKKLTAEGVLKTAGKGAATSLGVEVPGEVTQAMIERLQAGLPLLNNDALEEYGKTAFSTTMLAPMGAAGRFNEKSNARTLLQDEEDKKARETRRLEEEALNQKRQTPDYAKEVEQKYLALEQQRNDLKSQKIKIDESSPTVEADKAFNKDLERKIEELGKNEIRPAAKEYMAVKPILDQMREQERLAATSPEDVMMEHLGMKMPEVAAKPPAPLRVDEFGRVTDEAPAEERNPVQDYAAQQIQAARESGQLTPTDFADYLMQDPAMAAQVVKERPAIEGFKAKDLATIYGGVNMRLKDLEKQGLQASKAELAQRQTDLKSQQLGPTVDQMDMFKSSSEQVEEQRATAETNFDYLDPIFEKAVAGKPRAVTVPADVKADDRAPAMRERIAKLVAEADQAEKAYRQARALKERPAASEAFSRRSAALKQLDVLGAEGGAYAQNLIAARRAQETALGTLEETTQRLKSQELLGKEDIASANVASLQRRAEAARAEFITNALQEAALNRRAAGKQPLTQDEAIKAASKLYDTVNDWVERAATQAKPAKYEEKIVQPAQMRANKIVRPAVTERIETEPAVQGISPAEVKHFKSRIDAVRSQLNEVPSTPARVETLLKPQFAATEAKKVGEAKGETAGTLGGELRRHSEYTLTNLAKAMLRDLPQGGIYEGTYKGQPYVYRVEDMRELLEKARDVIEDGKASRELLDAVDAQVERILRGEDTGNMLMKRREIVSEKRVGETEVPKTRGEETEYVAGAPREGVRRKFATVGYEEERAPLSEYQQDIKDALAAAEPTAIEQKEAGQKSLFPETEKDLGYIRMSPKNFANSPKIMEAWSALDKARALAKKKADKDAIVTNRSKAVATTISRLNDEIDRIKNDTKFFWTNTKQWTDYDLAKAYVGYPEIGNNPEEQKLVDRYLADKGRGLTQAEKETVAELLRQFNSKKMPEYQKHLQEATQILAQGGRLEDLDNQLLQTMQSANLSVRNQAAELRKELAVMRTAIKQMRSISKNDRKDPLAKRINALEVKAEQAKSQYRERVEKLFTDSRAEMDAALAEILDPDIKNVKADLDKALKTLEKEKAALDRTQKKVQAILEQPTGKDRMQLVAYEQFRYEEKKDIIEALEKKIKDQQADLENLMDTRMNAHDTAAAVMQAVTDKKVQNLRDRIIDLETNVATLRGEGVTATVPGRGKELPALKYPFAAQKADAELKAAQAELKGAERQQTETAQEIKSQARQLEDIWREMWGGFGKRRVGGRVETLSSTEQNRLDKLREDAYQAEDRAEAAYQKNEAKRVYTRQLEGDINELTAELSALPDLPADVTELQKIVEDDTTPPTKFNAAMAKLSLLHDIEELQSQIEVAAEGKPSRKQKALTVETTAKQSARTAFRTGDLEAGVERRFQAYREKTGYTKALSPEEFAKMEQADLAYSNELAKSIRGTKAPEIKIKAVVPTVDQQAGIDPFYDDFEFSRGGVENGLNKADLEAEIERGMGESLFGRDDERQISKKIEVFNSVDEFTAAQPEYDGKIPADAKGFVHNGKAVLFANNIEKGHGLGVFLHEVGVHTGFRNFFNKNQYGALVNAVKTWATRNDDSMEAKVGKAALARVKAAQTPESQVEDELLAYAVEEAMRMGVSPTGVKNGTAINNWLRMVVDAFKKVLAKFGVSSDKLTAGDFVNMAYGAAQLEMKGTWHGTGVEFDQFDHAYMGSGEGHQAFGWGTYRAQKHGLGTHYREVAIESQLNKWYANPDVRAWRATQEVLFDGMSAMKVREFAMSGKGGSKGLTRDMAWLVRDALVETNEHMQRFPDSVPSDIFKMVMVENIDEATHASDKSKEEAKRAKEWVEENKFKVSGKSLRPTYRNSTDFHWNTGEWRVLSRLNRDGSTAPFAERVKAAIAEVREEQELTAHAFRPDQSYVEDGDEEMYKDAVRILKELDTLDVNQFAYNPPDAPPIPRPTGAIMRVLHTRPENEYILWDKPLEDQPPAVKKAFEGVLNQFDAKANQELLRYMKSVGKVHGRDMYTGISAVFEHAGIPSQNADQFTTLALSAEGAAGIKFFDRQSRDNKAGYFNYVDFSDKDEGAQIVGTNIDPVRFTDDKNKEMLFSRAASYNSPEAREVGESLDKFIAKNKSTTEKVRAAAGGFLGLETQLVDRFAPLERVSKVMDALKGSQMMYYLRMYDQRMHFVQQAVGTGALSRVEKERKDGQKEYVIESKPGASIKGVVQILKDAQPFVGNGEAVNRMFTAYMSAIRANSKGFAALSFAKDVTETDLRKAEKFVNANKDLKAIFEDARREYNEYNRGMVNFLAETGAISEQLRKELTQENDYIPWYRESGGVAELMIGNESRIRIGSIAEQPYLHELVGGDKPILDFMVSSVQNTNMLVDMGMRNLATKNAVFELVDLKMAKIIGATSGPDVVKFREDGEDRYAQIDGTAGIPGDLIVKGMEGIPTQMPALFRMMSMPSRLLRKAVTLTPMYAAKQLFRDSLAAPIVSGANFKPVWGALKEINKPSKEILERRGITGGQQFTGTNEDLSMILREITDGKPGWMSALAKAEAVGMEADALTRRAQYNSYIEQGLSEMEATLMALESMNFNKRGASPSIHIAGAMIPFFNSQIQALNVLYKAMTGKLPFNERLKIQEKMLQRGAMLAVGTLAYAALMQDDEAYKNATPEQKYGNWFVRIPGVDEPVRIPVPFEIGYIFKALPEALYNTMVNERGGEDAAKAFRQILLQTIPGGSSYLLPQAIKPAIEAGLGKSFYTGRDILSAHEQQLLPEEQFRVNTSEAAKLLGKTAGVSPIMVENLVNGYTGAMGLAFLQAVSIGIPKGNTPEQATKRLSDLPLVGGSFQPNDAGGIINATYDRFSDAVKVQRTVDKMFEEGRQAEAKALLQKTGNEYAVGEVGDYFTTQMKELTQYERAVQAMRLTPTEKRAKLDEIKQMKISLASTVRQQAEKIARR